MVKLKESTETQGYAFMVIVDALGFIEASACELRSQD